MDKKNGQKKSKEAAETKTVFSSHRRLIWPSFPETISWLQKSRVLCKEVDVNAKGYETSRGTNATIILLSATCIEGFLVECLNTYTLGCLFSSKDSFEGRLDHDFLRRVSTATFGDFRELFALTLGKPISELVQDKKLIAGIKALIWLRNGIAHGRSIVYLNTTTDLEDYIEYEVESQYRDAHKYLEENTLVFNDEEIFTDKVADHFAALMKPYMESVIKLLPNVQSDNVKQMVQSAYRNVKP